jgi:hypothetical protein
MMRAAGSIAPSPNHSGCSAREGLENSTIAGFKSSSENGPLRNVLTRKNIRRKFAAKILCLFKNFFESTFPAIARSDLRRHVGCFPAKESAIGSETGRHRDASENGRRANCACRVGGVCVLPASGDCVGAFARKNTPEQAANGRRPAPVIACYDFSKSVVCLEIPGNNR